MGDAARLVDARLIIHRGPPQRAAYGITSNVIDEGGNVQAMLDASAGVSASCVMRAPEAPDSWYTFAAPWIATPDSAICVRCSVSQALLMTISLIALCCASSLANAESCSALNMRASTDVSPNVLFWPS